MGISSGTIATPAFELKEFHSASALTDRLDLLIDRLHPGMRRRSSAPPAAFCPKGCLNVD
jgi:hypothetical protein